MFNEPECCKAVLELLPVAVVSWIFQLSIYLWLSNQRCCYHKCAFQHSVPWMHKCLAELEYVAQLRDSNVNNFLDQLAWQIRIDHLSSHGKLKQYRVAIFLGAPPSTLKTLSDWSCFFFTEPWVWWWLQKNVVEVDIAKESPENNVCAQLEMHRCPPPLFHITLSKGQMISLFTCVVKFLHRDITLSFGVFFPPSLNRQKVDRLLPL